jgi:hypothetical protein
MNFGSLKQFLHFKIIEKQIKIRRTVSGRNRLVATVRGPTAYDARSAERLAGQRPGGPTQPRRWPARYVRAACASAWSPNADHVRDGAVVHSPADRWRLAGSNFLG